MKKSLVAAGIAFLVLAGGALLKAQTVYYNLGWVNEKGFPYNPFVWTLGSTVDVEIGGQKLFLTGELNMAFYKLKFREIWLQPGVMMNVRFGSVFLGAGPIRYFRVAGDFLLGRDDFMVKFVGGWQGRSSQIRIFVNLPFKDVTDGWMLGMQSGISF